MNKDNKLMCWNYQVSLLFSGLYLIINCYYVIKKPIFWKEYLLFGLFYMMMEIFQTTQWLFGQVYENSSLGISSCNPTNTIFTIIGHILIWLQPVLYSYIGYRTHHKNNFFINYFYLTSIIFIYAMLTIYLGFNAKHHNLIYDSIYGLSTCTSKGATGHLVWKIKSINIDYSPNYLMYLVLCGLSFIMYEKKKIQLIGIGWILSLILTKIILKPSLVEFASSWCLMSIFANAIMITFG